MPREPATPADFAVAEAQASGASVMLVAWEINGEIHWRTVPGHQSTVILEGFIARLSEPDCEEVSEED